MENTMPTVNELIKGDITARQWLTYYKNVWTRNLIARTIDVATDSALKAKDAEQTVQLEDGSQVPVKERLEHRKMIVQDAIDLLKAIDLLLAIPEGEFAGTVWSEEALKVAADMLPPEPVVGGACKTSDGTDGVYADMDGKLVCVVPEVATAEVVVEPAVETTPEATVEATPAETPVVEETPVEEAPAQPETAQEEVVA